MRRILLQRIVPIVPLLVGVSAITFLLLHLAPGDYLSRMAEDPQISAGTIDAMRRRFGLDQPWYVQYGLYLRNIFLRLDFGESFSRHQPVFHVLATGFWNTLLLSSAAAVVTWGAAIPLGVWAAVRQHTWVDRLASLAAFVWLSIPEVLSGLLFVWVAAKTRLLPVDGMRSVDFGELDGLGRMLDIARHLVLPALVVGLIPLAGRMRQMRSSLLDVLRLDFVTTARAKGLPESTVVFKHALRNALNPMITLFGFTLGSLVSGSFVAEVIFSWPGLGRITLDAILSQDQYLVMGSVLMASCVLVIGNGIADVLLAIADPRLRHE